MNDVASRDCHCLYLKRSFLSFFRLTILCFPFLLWCFPFLMNFSRPPTSVVAHAGGQQEPKSWRRWRRPRASGEPAECCDIKSVVDMLNWFFDGHLLVIGGLNNGYTISGYLKLFGWVDADWRQPISLQLIASRC